MKTKIFIFMVFMSFLASCLSSCKDEISDAAGSWVCNPEPDVTITLTFKSGKTYVNTSPQILYDNPMPSGNTYVFNDGSQFIVSGNALYSMDSAIDYAIFDGTMLSSNRMSLRYLGILDAFSRWVRDYTFERKYN